MTARLPTSHAPPNALPSVPPFSFASGREGIDGEALEVAAKDVYMIGIGGCGMSGLARMFVGRGARVSGSDMTRTDVTGVLEAEQFEIGFDQTREWLPDACDMVVASAAIKPDHPQLMEAQRRGVPVLTYAEALGRCMIGRTGVAIAGTHGKSTTTAMLGTALVDARLDPTVIVGAICPQLVRGTRGAGSNLSAVEGAAGFRLGAKAIPQGDLAGQPGLLLAEACEYNRSFHNFHPTIASISSVEADHLDVYGSIDAVVEAFAQFAALVPPADEGGRLLIGHDGAHRREVTAGLSCKVETIGYSPAADWVVSYDKQTREVCLTHDQERLASWCLKMPGEHSAMNSAVACVLACMVGADVSLVAASLEAFGGLDRRLQFLGERVVPGSGGGADGSGAVRVYDDYGHHPTEIDATLRALRDFEKPQERGGKLICVFQPHQHSRTRHLLEEFTNVFAAADVVIVPHIYFVRDSIAEKHKVSASDLVDRLRQRGVKAMHLYPFEAIVEQLENVCRPGDLLVVMGAGPVWQVARGYLDAGMEGASCQP